MSQNVVSPVVLSILDNGQQLHIGRWYNHRFLNPYDDKIRLAIYAELCENGLNAVAERYKGCGRVLGHMHCGSCGHKKPVKHSCNLVLCPDCRSKRMGKLASRLRPMYQQMKRPRFLTLTVPNVTNLRAGFKEIGLNFSKLRRQECFQGVKSGVSTREVTYNRTTWNVHMHILYDGFISYRAVMDAWGALTGSKWMLDEAVYGDPIAEIIGYCGKVPQFPNLTHYVEYYSATRGLRLTQTFGGLFKFKIPKEKKECECEECGSENVKFVSIFLAGGEGFDPPFQVIQ